MYIYLIYIYMYIHYYTQIYIYDIPSSYPFVEHLLPWHRQEPDSEGFLQKDPMKPQIQRLFEAQQTGPQKAGPKSTRNGRKPMETMDLQHGHGNIMVFLPWFFHSWKMNIGRCKFRTVTCKSSNPITKAKTHIMKNTHIYIHRCIYIYISVPNTSISISGKTSTFFSWQRRPPTWTTSWRSCWIHGFRRRRACWMIGTLKKWWGNNGFISWLIDLNRCQ